MERRAAHSGVLSIPGVERLKELETVGGGGDSDVDGGALGGRSLVGVCEIKSVGRLRRYRIAGSIYSCL
jgi:hypothetical protein